jgi:glucuronate isomerase
MLLALAGQYSARGWVMQIHFGCQRDNNSAMYGRLGPDTGFDSMNGDGRPGRLALLLDRMQAAGALPRTILYGLNPADSEALVSIAGCFMADAECPGKVQIGSAWWFNDSKAGIEKQLADFANGTLLGNFNGMLTDSRSFLSYTRHEYFRRILCNYLGTLVENGECRPDYEALGLMVRDICYDNALRFFGFAL